MTRKIGFVLVLLMALLQGFYGLFAYIDPVAFADVRGTALISNEDIDWVQIYGSRTLFVSLIIGALLYFREFKVLMWAALLGTVMPLTDGYLAYQAEAPFGVVAKHIATIAYLIITSVVLFKVIANEKA
ncbi:hypothetical protein PA25_15330 [Pseudoalteromonas sp. A25]|uniref:DUF4267 domain-containing protein n=1 Tax=Pseudoalteromonas sp. A25 TaxID=116092 RepID=UPI001260E221|nr:DUF4267 domain-containing protein [Pseudoalteromonas sp. A25]BBN81548.1 hypothetical protein PA25_15330 [Pseudoalteromonas sp. A25]